MRLPIVYYSQFGHIHRMAEAEAEGARSVPGTEVVLRRVPETLPQEVLEKTGAAQFQKEFSKVPVCTPRELTEFDAIIFGTPSRFGNMCGQIRQFFDATGGIWKAGPLSEKSGASLPARAPSTELRSQRS
jgi:NAD(P)H dehydrogenase (quinone)